MYHVPFSAFGYDLRLEYDQPGKVKNSQRRITVQGVFLNRSSLATA